MSGGRRARRAESDHPGAVWLGLRGVPPPKTRFRGPPYLPWVPSHTYTSEIMKETLPPPPVPLEKQSPAPSEWKCICGVWVPWHSDRHFHVDTFEIFRAGGMRYSVHFRQGTEPTR